MQDHGLDAFVLARPESIICETGALPGVSTGWRRAGAALGYRSPVRGPSPAQPSATPIRRTASSVATVHAGLTKSGQLESFTTTIRCSQLM